MSSLERKSTAKGEVSGAFLLGLLNSFHNLNVLPASDSIRELGTLDPTGWYPFGQLMDLLQEIHSEVPRAGAILFRAGVHFIRLWYEYGPGKTMVKSGRDWIFANQNSAGYNSVVRGGSKDEVGWCNIQKIDEHAGIVVYENVTPLSPDYVRGVFYGGCLLFDDMDYVDVAADSEDYSPNPDFIRTIVTVRFRYKPSGSPLDLEGVIGGAHQDDPCELGKEDVQRLLWRYRSQMVRKKLDSQYFDELSSLLVGTNKKSQELSWLLNAKVDELNAALHRVHSMEELLPICGFLAVSGG
jgi:hypothetical protein